MKSSLTLLPFFLLFFISSSSSEILSEDSSSSSSSSPSFSPSVTCSSDTFSCISLLESFLKLQYQVPRLCLNYNDASCARSVASSCFENLDSLKGCDILEYAFQFSPETQRSLTLPVLSLSGSLVAKIDIPSSYSSTSSSAPTRLSRLDVRWERPTASARNVASPGILKLFAFSEAGERVPLEEEDRGIKVQILSRYPDSNASSSFTSPDIEQLLCLGYSASFPSSDSASRWNCLSSSPSSSTATAIGVNAHERLYYIGDYLSSSSFSSSFSSTPGLAVVLVDSLLQIAPSSFVSYSAFWWVTLSIAGVFLILTLIVFRLQKHKSSLTLFSSFTPSTLSSEASLEGEPEDGRGDLEELVL